MTFTSENLDNIITKEYYKRFLFYKPNKKQQLFHVAGKEAQERLITGGNRSGKSYSSACEIAFHLTGMYPAWWQGHKFDKPINCWIAGKSAALIAETVQKDLIGDNEQNTARILHPEFILSKRKSGNSDMYRTVYVNHISGGASKITFKSFEEGREGFQGSKVELIWIDEEPPFDIYRECKMRTMSTSEDFHGMVIVSSTPLKGYTDFFNYFLDDRHPGEVQDSIWHAHIEWKDAEHLPETEKKRLLAGMSPHEIEARTKGVPWPGSGLVYPVPEELIVCDPFTIPNFWPRAFGLDFGWKNPTAAVFGAHDRDSDILYITAEYGATERTPEQNSIVLSNLGANWIPGVYDPAGRNSQQADGKQLVELYREAGIRSLSPANNAKEEGIMRVLQRMQNGQLKIFSTLPKTLSEFRKYSRDEDGIPNKKDDHFMDAMRYLVMSGLSVAIPQDYKEQKYHQQYYVGSQPGYI